MTRRSVVHASFTIDRTYPAAPSRVFAAFADAQTKQRWQACDPSWKTEHYSLDFRVGGGEVIKVGPPGGPLHICVARYHEITPDERIVYVYDMWLDEQQISTSLATIEIRREAAGARLILTEQGAFYDGYDGADEREEGTRVGLDRLAGMLAEAGAPLHS